MSALVRTPLALAAALAVLLLAGGAQAQRGIDLHLFHPSVDHEGLLTVERAETLPAWTVGFKLGFDFALAPLSARLTDAATQTVQRRTLVDWQLVAHVGLALGLAR